MTGTRSSDPVLERLLRLHPKKIDLSLGRLERLLARLGHPEAQLPPVFHIAGTNGKGSVTAIARAILEAAGHRVHVYTSPHLVHFNERIRVNGSLIDDGALSGLLEECESVNDGAPITFFEVTTAAAFLAFARHEADACILEVGLGGRLDATNVLADPTATIASAITPVHFDHQAFLGTKLADIAFEKAGIIKEGVPVTVSRQPLAVSRVIAGVAASQGAKLLSYGRDWQVEPWPGRDEFIYSGSGGEILLPRVHLEGDHQILNAGQAIAMLRSQSRLAVPNAAIRAGLDWVRWPARLQRLEGDALAGLLPEGSELWLDGGHNVLAARVLKYHFRSHEIEQRPFYLVVGMMGAKDAGGFLKRFAGLARSVTAVPVPGEDGAMRSADLAAAATSVGLASRLARDIPAALKAIADDATPGPAPVVLIAGSLYLAGEALRLAGPNAADF